MSIRRINLWGGPGTGKSTKAADLFARLKTKGYSVELVPEYIKSWAYEGKSPKSFDQLFVFANQVYSEDRLLPYVDVIISDSPILLVSAYSKHHGFDYLQPLTEVAKNFEVKYPSLNFFLNRTFDYKQEGRFQKVEEVKNLDELIWQTMMKYCPPDRTYRGVSSMEELVATVEASIKGK